MNLVATEAAAITAGGVMSAAMIAAAAALGAALFAFLASWLSSVSARRSSALQARIAQQIKHAEFRQAWINDLRTAMVEFQRLTVEVGSPSETKAFGNALQMLLRMNPKDPNYQTLLDKIDALIKDPEPAHRDRWLDEHAEFVALCQKILKTEWDVLKSDLQDLSYVTPAKEKRGRRGVRRRR